MNANCTIQLYNWRPKKGKNSLRLIDQLLDDSRVGRAGGW